MMALTIGTLPPLHKSPLQQLISHFFTFPVSGLQKSAVSVSHWDDIPQPLPYTANETSSSVPSFMPLTQRSRFSSQVVSFLTLSQSSQLFVEAHSKHFRPHPKKNKQNVKTTELYTICAKVIVILEERLLKKHSMA